MHSSKVCLGFWPQISHDFVLSAVSVPWSENFYVNTHGGPLVSGISTSFPHLIHDVVIILSMISVQRDRLLELSRQHFFLVGWLEISDAKVLLSLSLPLLRGASKNSTMKQIWGNISNTALQIHLLSCSCHPIPISGVWTTLSKLDLSLAGMAPFHAKSVRCPQTANLWACLSLAPCSRYQLPFYLHT
jgi:hypothetical protein